jgi:CheY-like chemotaxis protein
MPAAPLKILIVDDDESVLIELERLLETEGYSTVTAWSGRDALALSMQMKFDLLLVDEHLADIDATTLLDTLHHTQPEAFRLVMHSCAAARLRRRPPSTNGSLMK